MDSESEHRAWHWLSTPRTTERLEPSILSLVETALAVSISIYLISIGLTAHLVIGALFFPLLLLRTLRSTEESIESSVNVIARMKDAATMPQNMLLEFPMAMALTLVASIVLVWIRVQTTIIHFVRHPLASLKNIPDNWWRVVGCIDTWHPPEPVPGFLARHDVVEIELRAFFHPTSWISGLLGEFQANFRSILKSPTNFLGYCALIVFFVPLTILFFICPAIVYRWSLKSTLIFFLPLIWLVRTAEDNIRLRFKKTKELALHKLRRWFGAFLIALFICKWLWFNLVGEWYKAIKPYDPNGVFEFLIAPSEIPLWQIASVLNAGLVIILYVIADFALFGDQSNEEGEVSLGYRVAARLIWGISPVLAFYTLSIVIYNVGILGIPPIGDRLFPDGMVETVFQWLHQQQ